MTHERRSYGTPHQQALLDAFVSLYSGDPRAQAVIVFGSLARGDWHAFSDIDLDIVLEHPDNVELELERLAAACAALGDRALVIVRDGDDSGDLVLESLAEISVRFHTLAVTSPNIVSSMGVLWSRVDHALIAAAGAANRRPQQLDASNLLNRCLRYALEIDIAWRRDALWLAVELLHHVRGHLMEILAAAHGQPRPLAAWQQVAGAELDALLRATLPGPDPASLPACRDAVLEILEHRLPELSNGTLALSADQRALLAALHKRIRA